MSIRRPTASNSYYLVASASAFDRYSHTIAFWVRIDAAADDGADLVLISGSSLFIGHWASDGFYVWWNGDYTIGTTPPSDGVWYHVAVTMDPDEHGVLYVDGVLEGEVSSNSSGAPSQLIVPSNSDPNWKFAGELFALKVWNAALTQIEVQNEMRAVRALRRTDLWAEWPLLDRETMLKDVSGNGLNLTETGSSLTTGDNPGRVLWYPPRSGRRIILPVGGGSTVEISAALSAQATVAAKLTREIGTPTLYLTSASSANGWPSTSKLLSPTEPSSEVQLGPGEFDAGFPGTSDAGQWNPSSPLGDTTLAAEIDNTGSTPGTTREGWLWNHDLEGFSVAADATWTLYLKLRANQGSGQSGRICLRVSVVTSNAGEWATVATLLTTRITGSSSLSGGQEGWRDQDEDRITVTSTAEQFVVTFGGSGVSAAHDFQAGERLLFEFGFCDGNSNTDRTWRLDYNQGETYLVLPTFTRTPGEVELSFPMAVSAAVAAGLAVDKTASAPLAVAASLAPAVVVDRVLSAPLAVSAAVAPILRVDKTMAASLDVAAALVIALTLDTGGDVLFSFPMDVATALAAAVVADRALSLPVAVATDLDVAPGVDRALAVPLAAGIDVAGVLRVDRNASAALAVAAGLAGNVRVDRNASASLAVQAVLAAALRLDRGLAAPLAVSVDLAGNLRVDRNAAFPMAVSATVATASVLDRVFQALLEIATDVDVILTIEAPGEVLFSFPMTVTSGAAAALAVQRALAAGLAAQTGLGAALAVDWALAAALGIETGLAARVTTDRALQAALAVQAGVSISLTVVGKEITLTFPMAVETGLVVGLRVDRLLSALLAAQAGLDVAITADRALVVPMAVTTAVAARIVREMPLQMGLNAATGLAMILTIVGPKLWRRPWQAIAVNVRQRT